MRVYLLPSNMARALRLGAVVTVAAIPRLVQGGVPLRIYVPALFFSMSLVAGSVTAWGGCGGMAGLWPPPAVRRRMTLWAVAAALAFLPLFRYGVDPIYNAAVRMSGDLFRIRMQSPPTASARTAAVLWRAGFHVLFFYAGAMSFFARITHRWMAALALTVGFRLFVGWLQLEGLDLAHPLLPMAAGAAATATAAVLFAKGGLLPPVVFAAILEARVFFNDA